MGGPDLMGGANSRGSYVSKNLYVKMKESGPVGGRAPVAPPPGSATGSVCNDIRSKSEVVQDFFLHF